MSDPIQKVSVSETIGEKTITFQTGTLAKQAGGSVTTHIGETVTLTAATANIKPKEISFVPLTSDYRERTYAAGKIPGGFFKREARPREKETLTARLIDRPIRPLFPEGWNFETMIANLVVSSDLQNDPDMLALNGASAALMLSDIPWNGPVAAVRIIRKGEDFTLLPTYEEREGCDLELIIAGKKGAILMIEGSASEVAEDVFTAALEIAQTAIDKLCDLQHKLVEESEKAGRKTVKREFTSETFSKAVEDYVTAKVQGPIKEALRAKHDKFGLDGAIRGLKDSVKKEIAEDVKTKPELEDGIEDTSAIIEEVLYNESRVLTLDDRVRPDGRKFDEIRPIDIQLPVFERVHGSAVFTRGQTQALATCTLGSPSDAQVMDVLEGEYKERFMLHYNFPSFSVGEVRPERGPGRREIGHGALARRSFTAVLPPDTEFPYTIRLVSEILESNGSSSMATICGGSLALFDAGVPMKAAVAGIAMGLVIKDGKYAVLTDIAGIEDHNGDMDFKVAGTAKGITAFQLDMKVEGLSVDILKEALAQARTARLFILDKMNAAIDKPRAELSKFAPRLLRVQIPTNKIGALIGPGGKNIRRLIDTYGVEVEVEDDGSVFIAGIDATACNQAKAEVEAICEEAEVGKIYKGHVVSIKEFGAFVEILPGKEGLLHISQIDVKRVERVEDVLKEGDDIEVKVLEVDSSGKMRLSRKAVISPGSEKDGNGSGPRRGGPGRGGPRRGGDRGGRR